MSTTEQQEDALIAVLKEAGLLPNQHDPLSQNPVKTLKRTLEERDRYMQVSMLLAARSVDAAGGMGTELVEAWFRRNDWDIAAAREEAERLIDGIQQRSDQDRRHERMAAQAMLDQQQADIEFEAHARAVKEHEIATGAPAGVVARRNDPAHTLRHIVPRGPRALKGDEFPAIDPGMLD